MSHGDHDHDHEGHGHDHEGCGHDHHHDDALDPSELTSRIVVAQSGTRSAVATLIEALGQSDLFVPLADDIPDAVDGMEMDLDGELTFSPHMLVHEDGSVFAVAYSDPGLAEQLVEELEWKTSGDDLKMVQLPANVALELAQGRSDGGETRGLVLNPGTDFELLLLRDEAASISQGVALPLVAYVHELPREGSPEDFVVAGAAAPPQALLDALEVARKSEPALSTIHCLTTYDPERDREPHLTLSLELVDETVDRGELAERLMDSVSEHLPAPGYADVVFRRAPS